MTKVRFDTSADFWDQAEERGCAESRADYDGGVLSILKSRKKVDELSGPSESCDDPQVGALTGPLESCDDAPHAADEGRCADEQDEHAHDAPRGQNSLFTRRRKDLQHGRQDV